MKKNILLILLLLTPLLMQAAPLSQQQKQTVIANINKAVSGLQSMSCSFVQTKQMKMLNDKMTSRGQMHYKQGNKLRWEYTTPYKYLFIFNGTKVYVGNKAKKDVIDTNSNKVFREVARIMMNTVTGKALSNKADFTTDVASSGNSWVVTLVPKKRDLRNMFSKIQLLFNKSNYMISEVNIFEKNGDKSNIKMQGISTNKAINESVFAIPR